MLVDKFLYGQVENPHKLKELKVKIPLHYHMRLHGLKILGEDSISASVGKALELYFQKLGTPVPGANAPEGAAANETANVTTATGATGSAAGANVGAVPASAPGVGASGFGPDLPSA
jgi:hypothetical protein